MSHTTTKCAILNQSKVLFDLYLNYKLKQKLSSPEVVSFMLWHDVADFLEYHSIGANGYRNTVRILLIYVSIAQWINIQ